MKADGGQKDAEYPMKWLVSGGLDTFFNIFKRSIHRDTSKFQT
jgi:hypothetical protein